MSGGEAAAARQQLVKTQWRQLGLITAGAVALFFGLRALPTGTNLSHMDFRVDPKGSKALEFCDPANPQFIPVVAVRSPVVMTITTSPRPSAGQTVTCTVNLQTASGKPIGPADLVYAHTRKMHLLIVDETLQDYQHVHPDAGVRPGSWQFTFTPHRAGGYRVFADFTPAATGRGLYASVDLPVARSAGERTGKSERTGTASEPLADARSHDASPLAGARSHEVAVSRDGYRFMLTPAKPPMQAGRRAELALAISRDDGGAVPLEPVMDALAHLVAFDETRSGFAHLHPVASDLDPASGPARPVLRFQLTIPKPGRYVIWAQLNLAGRETFVPFWFEVVSASGGNQG